MMNVLFSPFLNALSGANTANTTTNEKGAKAFLSTGDAPDKKVLDFFFQAVRGLTGDRLTQLLDAAWNDNALLTLKAIYQLRDIRGGKGERKLFRECLVWLARKDAATLLMNLRHIPEYGRWDDLYTLWEVRELPEVGPTIWNMTLKVICDQIKTDWELIAAIPTGVATTKLPHISLLAKWLTLENSTTWPKAMTKSLGKAVVATIGKVPKIKVVKSTVEQLVPRGEPGQVLQCYEQVPTITITRGDKVQKGWAANYRTISVTMRAILELPEVLLAAKRSSEIVFNLVSGQAMRRYGKTCPTKCGDEKCKKCKAFISRENERFKEFLAELEKPKDAKTPVVAKVNARTLQPHEVVSAYLSRGSNADPMLDAMWEGILERITGNLNDFFCLVDVSSSMDGIPMQVAIGLGLLVATKSTGPFANSMITFHETPQFITLKKTTLHERVQEVKALPWGGSTQIHRAFTLILNQAKKYHLHQEDLPKYFLILSDMNFDEPANSKYSNVVDSNWRTNLEAAAQDFHAAGYKLPRLILWNLRSSNTFPTSENVADHATLMSGFSPDVLNSLLKGEQFNPASAMLNVLNDERYARLTLAPQ